MVKDKVGYGCTGLMSGEDFRLPGLVSYELMRVKPPYSRRTAIPDLHFFNFVEQSLLEMRWSRVHGYV